MGNVVVVGGGSGKQFDDSKPFNSEYPLYAENTPYLHEITRYKEASGTNFKTKQPEDRYRWIFKCIDPNHPELNDKVATVLSKTYCSTHANNMIFQLFNAAYGHAPLKGTPIDLDDFVGKHVKLLFKQRPEQQVPGADPKTAHGMWENVVQVVSPAAQFSPQGAPGQGPLLPPGWQSATDPNTGQTFYVDPQGKSHWTPPAQPGMMPAQGASVIAAPTSPPPAEPEAPAEAPGIGLPPAPAVEAEAPAGALNG